MRWRDKPITATDRMKAQTRHRTQNLQTKIFHAKKSFKKGKEEVIGERQKVNQLIQKCFYGEMQRCVGVIISAIAKIKDCTDSLQVVQNSYAW